MLPDSLENEMKTCIFVYRLDIRGHALPLTFKAKPQPKFPESVHTPKSNASMKSSITHFLSLLAFTLLTTTTLLAQSGSLEGTIISRKGNVVTIRPTSFTGTAATNGTVADMSKHFEEKMGNMTMSGWLVVAKVEFIPTSHQNTDIKILEEKSEITVNDEKVNHFKVGKRIKLEWPAKVEEPQESTK
jgi:hypothetical protein